ncbi:MAG: hypothetical protein Q8918_01350 [Bacteroidota bacterium]|nr:hypothetical protein [Bacteroidota bacterium]
MKINISNPRRLAGIIILAAYFMIISGLLIRSFHKPEYNWDMLAYIAVVLSRTHKDIGEIHRDTYAAVRDQIPSASFQQLVNPANNYRINVYRNDTAFYQQLPFYVVKPLYTTLVYLGYRSGFSLPASTVLPSVLACLFIAGLLLIWFSRYLSLFYAAAAALLLMLSAPLLTVSGLSTPDALSAFLLLCVFYFIIEKPMLVPVIFFMTAAILTRLDNIIACVLIVFLMAIAKEPPFKIRVSGFLGLFFWLSAVYFMVSRAAGAFGFGILYYPSFLSYLNMAHQFHSVFSWSAYLQVFRSDAVSGFYHSAIALFGFLALLLFYRNRSGPLRSLSFYSLLPVLLCGIIGLRFILDPDISDRFYIPYYLFIAVLWVKSFTESGVAAFQRTKI